MRSYEYPTILRRYLSTLIDSVLIFTVLIIVPYIFEGDSVTLFWIRLTIAAVMVLIYEPFFTSKFCTLGQKITGIRIRTHSHYQRVSIPAAYIRIFLKVILGFISFIAIIFSKDKRAIHDFAAGSIVVTDKPLGKTQIEQAA